MSIERYQDARDKLSFCDEIDEEEVDEEDEEEGEDLSKEIR
jgi:hypothetical protein